MDEPWQQHAKWKKKTTKGHIISPLWVKYTTGKSMRKNAVVIAYQQMGGRRREQTVNI